GHHGSGGEHEHGERRRHRSRGWTSASWAEPREGPHPGSAGRAVPVVGLPSE
ncbi:unnamed protein product, partial [Prorocentrum cordatum]